MTQAISNLTPVQTTVRGLIAQIIGLPPARVVGRAALGADLGATSVDTVELVMAIEDEFAIQISDDRAAAVVTVDDLECLILRLQACQHETIAA